MDAPPARSSAIRADVLKRFSGGFDTVTLSADLRGDSIVSLFRKTEASGTSNSAISSDESMASLLKAGFAAAE